MPLKGMMELLQMSDWGQVGRYDWSSLERCITLRPEEIVVRIL